MNDHIVVTAIVKTIVAKAYRTGTSRELTTEQKAAKLTEATITGIDEILGLLRQKGDSK
jgi:hypothetical protein